MTESMAETSAESDLLLKRLEPLFAGGNCHASELGLPDELVTALGFDLIGGLVCVPENLELLDRLTVEQALTEKARSWLSELAVYQAVGSTSTMLMDLSSEAPVDGLVYLAELQVQGRGRRGRRWLSPYARNLAVSLGVRVPRKPDELGGASLCVGLAVLDTLTAMGVSGVELKWPNDVLVQGRKLAGILIELIARGDSSELVIGVGMNFSLPDAAREEINQPSIDVAELGLDLSRNETASGLISSIVDYMEGFADRGFAPMCNIFNDNHHFQDRSCRIIQGDRSFTGLVRGVNQSGGLVLETADGPLTFNSGEVSLREA